MSLPKPVLEENQVYNVEPSYCEEEKDGGHSELRRRAYKIQILKLLRNILKNFEDPDMEEYFDQLDKHYFIFKVEDLPTGKIPCGQNIALDDIIHNIRKNYHNIASIKVISHEEMKEMLDTAKDLLRDGLICEVTYEDIRRTYAVWDKVLIKITGNTSGVYDSLFQVGDTIATVLAGMKNSNNVCVTVTETDRSVRVTFPEEEDLQEGDDSTVSA